MLSFLKGPLLGSIMLLLFIINTLIWAGPLIIVSLIKVIVPIRGWRQFWTGGVCWVAESWMRLNLGMVQHLIGVDWKIQCDVELARNKSYLITANHQSWVDILALYAATITQSPYLRFFIKQELIWVPILGLAWWALDFPFMKRYSKAYLEKHPEKRGKDLETTRIACEKFRGSHVSIINFMEGARYNKDAKRRAESPFQNLLSPKAGGIAFVLGALGDQLDELLNATIYYPGGSKEMWEFLCGELPEVTIYIQTMKLPPELENGDYQNDAAFREDFQRWINGLWEEKDAELARMRSTAF